MRFPYSDEKEKAIERRILSYLKASGFWTLKVHGGPWQTPGIPDVLAIRRGRAYWFEVKRPGQNATKLQERTIAELRSTGCVAAVVHSLEEVVDCLN
jgi:Holliday junction resolvase